MAQTSKAMWPHTSCECEAPAAATGGFNNSFATTIYAKLREGCDSFNRSNKCTTRRIRNCWQWQDNCSQPQHVSVNKSAKTLRSNRCRFPFEFEYIIENATTNMQMQWHMNDNNRSLIWCCGCEKIAPFLLCHHKTAVSMSWILSKGFVWNRWKIEKSRDELEMRSHPSRKFIYSQWIIYLWIFSEKLANIMNHILHGW